MKEYHYIFKAKDVNSLIRNQEEFFAGVPEQKVVFKRYLLADAGFRKEFPVEDGAVSYIQQPPLDGNSVAVWVYAVSGATVAKSSCLSVVSDAGVKHYWRAGISSSRPGSEAQTSEILERYQDELNAQGLNMADDCVRTWFFVGDIDNNYAGMVKGRRENFERIGLTSRTHYIASTGIAGVPCTEGGVVLMDAWSVDGVGKCSRRYLYAPTHLNPTYEYGVTFERGVRIDYSAAAHLIISGTASIDNKGDVLHIGDVVRQTGRMWENVEVLLKEGGASWNNVKVILVYIRNVSDYESVASIFAEKFPNVPYVILHAPVCRPDWLIEMECIASFDL